MQRVLIKVFFFLFQYVFKIPRTESEIHALCQSVSGGVIMLKTSKVYGDPQSKTCKGEEYGPPPRGDFYVAYSLKARIVYPTGYIMGGKEQNVVSCCYRQPVWAKRMYWNCASLLLCDVFICSNNKLVWEPVEFLQVVLIADWNYVDQKTLFWHLHRDIWQWCIAPELCKLRLFCWDNRVISD